ncbi:MAG TPA: ankyrin repeat domain-containing protein [Chlamydiales bacterium]|nr:ankyrin repeat domain-containing protein [Chlamydiales bacterium]
MTAIPSQTVTVSSSPAQIEKTIKKRTELARKIEKQLNNFSQKYQFDCVSRLNLFEKQAEQERFFLDKTKKTPKTAAAIQALKEHDAVIQRVRSAAEYKIYSTSSHHPQQSGKPWEGVKLRPKEIPLHWAVRNHRKEWAKHICYRMQREQLFQAVNDAVKVDIQSNKKIFAALENYLDNFSKVIDAIEILHASEQPGLDKKALFNADKDLLKLMQNSHVSKLLDQLCTNPEVVNILWGINISMHEDANKLSPLDEAILQEDAEMIQILRNPQLGENPILDQRFQKRTEGMRSRIEALRKINPAILTPASRAAYEGNLETLKKTHDLDQADASGLKPLHYAILAGRLEAAQFLMQHSNLFALTPKGHSYLDYAIASKQLNIFQLFMTLRLPFTLGAPHEQLGYRIVSGIFDQALIQTAKMKDPLAKAGTEQTISNININAVWSLSTLIYLALGNSLTSNPNQSFSWLSSAVKFVMDTSYVYNLCAVSQIANVLPFEWLKNFSPTSIGMFALYHQITLNLGPQVRWFSEWINNPNTRFSHNPIALKLAQGTVYTYTSLRLLGAVKPVLDRISAYRDAFQSRPRKVMTGLMTDLFNIGTQAALTCQVFSRFSKNGS